MNFEFDDFNFKEQAEMMSMLNNYNKNIEIQDKQSIGFNQDFLYNVIDKK